jgi:hypothetical protein
VGAGLVEIERQHGHERDHAIDEGAEVFGRLGRGDRVIPAAPGQSERGRVPDTRDMGATRPRAFAPTGGRADPTSTASLWARAAACGVKCGGAWIRCRDLTSGERPSRPSAIRIGREALEHDRTPANAGIPTATGRQRHPAAGAACRPGVVACLDTHPGKSQDSTVSLGCSRTVVLTNSRARISDGESPPMRLASPAEPPCEPSRSGDDLCVRIPLDPLDVKGCSRGCSARARAARNWTRAFYPANGGDAPPTWDGRGRRSARWSTAGPLGDKMRLLPVDGLQ